jgi:glycosyltransferase involved in cell wall biosynthesis
LEIVKILFYNHTGKVSGAERLLLMILARLDRDSFDPFMVCPDQDALADLVAKLDVPVETLAGLEARFTWRLDHLARYGKSFVRVIRLLREKVRTIKPDLVHANSIRAGLVATAATFGLGTRVIWHIHDLLPHHPLSTLIRLFAFLSSRTRVIAVSEAVAGNFQGHFSIGMKHRVTVILNAIDLARFLPDQNARLRIRNELLVREVDPLIGIVGQVTPRKGQLELVQALAHVLPEIPNLVLLIAGAPLFNRDHEYLEAVARTAIQLGIRNNVRILGARSDIGAIMQSLDLLIVNSKVEPFGLVILEAMACGTPILAVAVDGIPEIIEHDKNGWLVPAQAEAVLAPAIVDLCRQPELRARLATQGRQDVAADFSVDRYLTELQKFYWKCVGLGTPTPALGNVAPTEPRAATSGLLLNCRTNSTIARH